METPTLNKKQKKATLSAKAKKQKPRETIKNVLTTPYNTSFWPEVSQAENIVIKKLLENNLPRVQLDKVNISWNELKSVPKSERKNFRLEYSTKINNKQEVDVTLKNEICIGINDVTKALEKDQLSAILITKDVQPRLMIQHLIDLAVMKKTPVLILENLRSILKHKCGISGVTVGFKKSAGDIPRLNDIIKVVQEIAQHHPVPQDHSSSEINQIDLEEMQQDISIERIIIDSEKETKDSNKVDEEHIRSQFYLKRESTKVRAFIPEEKSLVTPDVILMEIQHTEIPNKKLKMMRNYKPLKVKRVKSDLNRKKRILQSMKGS